MPTLRRLDPLPPGLSLDDYVRAETDAGVDIKSALMAHAALSRGLTVLRGTRRQVLVEAGAGRWLGFMGFNGPRSSVVGKELCDDKVATRALLERAGLSTVASRAFRHDEVDDAWAYAERLGGRVVVKPVTLSRGRGVSTDVGDRGALAAAFERAFGAYRGAAERRRVLVERQVDGDDVRFFVVGSALVSATLRRRAQVRGDGRSSVAALIDERNRLRALNVYLRASPIPVDPAELDGLRRAGMRLDSVPRAGQVVVLRGASNLSGGGDSVDLADRVHPGLVEVALRAVVAVPGIAYGGVDVITSDAAAAPTAANHVVGEVEFSPGPVSVFPVEGPRRDMAGAVLAWYLSLDA